MQLVQKITNVDINPDFFINYLNQKIDDLI